MLYRFLPEKLKRFAEKRWFNDQRRRAFYNKVSELYDNGIRIDGILESFERRAAKSGKGGGVETGFYKSVRAGFARSGSFAQALAPYAPIIERILIRAGEQSGHLSANMRVAGDLGLKNRRMKTAVTRALCYPLFILALAIAVLCWFSASLFPALEDFIPLSDWPLISRFLYSAGQIMTEWAAIGLCCALALFILFFWSLPRMTGKGRIILDRFPPWSFYRLSQGAAWIASLASMISAGTTGHAALLIVAQEAAGNRWLIERTNAVKDRLGSVRSLGEAMDTGHGFPDAELCEDMLDYAGSANFDKVFDKIGREWIDAGVEKVESEARVLNGCAMFFAMLVIVGLLQSIMGLMMDVSSVISGV